MSESADLVRAHLRPSAELKIQTAESFADDVARAAALIGESLEGGGKILLCGNGGSAADCQHMAAEFVGRLTAETIVGIHGSMVNGTSVIRPSPGGFAGVRPHTAVHCWSRAVPLTQRALGTQALPSGPGPAYARTTTSGVVVRERDRKPARRVPARDSPQAGAWPCPRAPTSRRFKRRTRLTCAVMPFALAGHATSAPGGVAMKSALESTGCR